MLNSYKGKEWKKGTFAWITLSNGLRLADKKNFFFPFYDFKKPWGEVFSMFDDS